MITLAKPKTVSFDTLNSGDTFKCSLTSSDIFLKIASPINDPIEASHNAVKLFDGFMKHFSNSDPVIPVDLVVEMKMIRNG